MKAYLIIILLSLVLGVSGQTAEEALRYATTNTSGTARHVALGGAFGAVGADLSLMSINPAGIGLYQSSEVTLTPGIHNTNNESIYNGITSLDKKNNFHLGNLAGVYTTPLKSRPPVKGWRHFQIAAGLNRLKDFNNSIDMAGPNAQNSFLDTYVEYAEGPPQISPTEIEQSQAYAYDLNLAWWTYLLDIYGDSTNYNYWQPVYYGGAYQSKNIETKGSMNEFSVNFSGNYNDRIYFGAAIGFPFFKYKETATYTEFDHMDTIPEFKKFDRIDYLETKGTGINLKLGIIYRPSDFIRLGLAVHTPSYFFRMKDYWWASMKSLFDTQVGGDTTHFHISPNGNYDYKLTTPFRAIGSIALIFGKSGLISADYEFANYSMSKFKSSGYSYSEENADIKNAYGVSHNIKVGTEWRYKSVSIRGGVNFMTSPYKNDINLGDRKSYSAGIGYRATSFFIDFAFRYNVIKGDYYFYYSPTYQPNPVENTYKSYDILLTGGYKF